nr:hypothetical protein Q903MT_gene2624 [Picea sitchensis]
MFIRARQRDQCSYGLLGNIKGYPRHRFPYFATDPLQQDQQLWGTGSGFRTFIGSVSLQIPYAGNPIKKMLQCHEHV